MLLWPPILWMGYFLVVYLFNEASCQLDFWRTPIWGRVTVYNLLALVVSLVVLLTLAHLGYRGWRLVQKKAEPLPGVMAQATEERDRLIGLSTVMFTLFLALLTVGLALTFLVLSPC